MGHSRPRYNAQRQEQLDARRNGKRRALDESGAAGDEEIIVPKTAEQKARERELKLLHEQNASKGKMSAKKKKRLDNYIDKKLKKEKRGELFKSLAASQETVASPLLLQPSSTLGSRQFKTNQDKLDRTSTLLDRKRQRVHDDVARHKRGYHSEESGEEEAKSDSLETPDLNDGPAAGPSIVRQAADVAGEAEEQPLNSDLATRDAARSASASLGSGLKGGVVPVVVQRTRKPIERRRFGKQIKPHLRDLGLENDDSEDSFDSSDSAYDTGSDEEVDGGDDDSSEEDGEDSSTAASEGRDFEEAEEWGGIADVDDEQLSVGAEDHIATGEVTEETSRDQTESAIVSLGKRKQPDFKAWAEEQLGIAVKETQGVPLEPVVEKPRRASQHTGPLRGPLGADLEQPAGSLLKPLDSTTAAENKLDGEKFRRRPLDLVERTEELQENRLKLPILAEEDAIMEAIRQHSVVVLCGETGSGKTTQVPQFLYESGFGSLGSDNPGMIGITQPRRVAAMSMATRVGQELSLPPSRVSYQIRYDATTSATTSIKFMTDGVLLRELANDFLLTRYSVIIVDEAHERSVNTDVLIGTLSRVVKLREALWRQGKEGAKPLRLLIMSATLRVTDFTENKQLFRTPPPLINVAARQHPVVHHFNRKTRPDYLGEAYKKVSKIHARLPPGGVLVFLTGQSEIVTLCKRLEKRFGRKSVMERLEKRKKAATGGAKWRLKEEDSEDKDTDVTGNATSSRTADIEAEEVDLGYEPKDLAGDVDDGMQDDMAEDPDALDTEDEEDDPDGLFADREEDSDTPMHILPLYSLLPTEKQMRVFRDPPDGTRLVVVATNVAETSLTIPNIKYVVDCGRAKERSYDTASGIQSFDISWISKASAAQRAGRAGRTGPGHCYRLYSSAVYERQFAQFGSPEILRTPIEGIVLQMKSMNIDQVVNFPFPTPPDRAALQKAERILVNLGALTAPSAQTGKQLVPARITELGNAMSLFPLSPRFSKMLVVGQQHGCLPYVIALVSALSVGDPFLRAESLGFGQEDDKAGRNGQQAEDELFEGEGAEILHIKSEDVKAKEIRRLQRRAFYQGQARHAALGKSTSDIFKILSVVGAFEYDGGSAAFCEKNFVRLKAMQEIHKLSAQISRIVTTNYPALEGSLHNSRLLPPSEEQLKILRQLLTAAFIDQVAIRKDLVMPAEFSDASKYESTRGVPYRAVGVNEDVFIHPSSVTFHNSPPECIVYQELVRTSKLYLKVITKINKAWLPTLGKPLCSFSRVLETSAATAAAECKGNTTDPNVRECFVVPKFAEFDNLALAPVKTTQRRIGSRWVFA